MYAFVAMTKSPNAVSRSRRQLDLSSLVYRARSVQKAVPNESPAPIKTPTRGSHCVISMLGCSHSPRPLSRTVPKGGRSSASRTHRLYQVRSISRGRSTLSALLARQKRSCAREPEPQVAGNLHEGCARHANACHSHCAAAKIASCPEAHRTYCCCCWFSLSSSLGARVQERLRPHQQVRHCHRARLKGRDRFPPVVLA